MKNDIASLVDHMLYYDHEQKVLKAKPIAGNDLYNRRYADKPIKLYKNHKSGIVCYHLRAPDGSTHVITIQHLLWIVASGQRTNHTVYFLDENPDNHDLSNVVCTPNVYYRFEHEPELGVFQLPSGEWQAFMYRTEYTRPARSPRFPTEKDARAWRYQQIKNNGLAWAKTAKEAWDERYGQSNSN